MPTLTPELDVSSLEESIAFYVGVAHFDILFQRESERFAFLRMGDSDLMLQEAAGPGRRFRTALLQRPFGRGVNFEIQVDDVASIHSRALAAGAEIIVDIEERSYRADAVQVLCRQFVVADPDGYLMRFSQPL